MVSFVSAAFAAIVIVVLFVPLGQAFSRNEMYLDQIPSSFRGQAFSRNEMYLDQIPSSFRGPSFPIADRKRHAVGQPTLLSKLKPGLGLPDGTNLDAYGSFGRSVSVSATGDIAIVGKPGSGIDSGAAYILEKNGEGWTVQTKLSPANGDNLELSSYFGSSVSISSDGTVALVGASLKDEDGKRDAGAVYVFSRSSSSASDWLQQGKLTAGDGTDVEYDSYFGSSVSISSDGTVALVGARWKDEDGKGRAGAAYVFSRSSTSASDWSQQGKLTAGDGTDAEVYAYFGNSVSISSDGTVALVGARGKDVDGRGDAGAVYVFSRSSSSASDWSQQGRLTAGDGTDVDFVDAFGSSVSISSDGTVALVGASSKDEDGKLRAGAAYVFSRSSTSASDWSQQGKLTAGDGTDAEVYAEFGNSVSISSDGTVALVGAYRKNEDGKSYAGAVYVFSRSSSSASDWSQQRKLTAGDGTDVAAGAEFGDSVSISSDGTVALVGAHWKNEGGKVFAGAMYVFSRSSTSAFDWSQQGKLTAGDGTDVETCAFFGNSVSISSDGTVALVGARGKDQLFKSGAGAVYVFSRSSPSASDWSQQGKLTAGDGTDVEADANFGTSVSISSDGTVALVGAYGKDEDGKFNAGAVYVFSRSSSNASDWSQQAKLTAGHGTDVQSYAFFGSSVSISSDGTVALVGAYLKDEDGRGDAGAVYVFSRSSPSASDWSQQAKLTAGDGTDVEAYANFGNSVSISCDGTVALVGALYKDEDGKSRTGAAYVFSRSSTSASDWSQQGKLTAGDGIDAVYDYFDSGVSSCSDRTVNNNNNNIREYSGSSVSISSDGKVALVGAFGKDEDGKFNAGAVYVFSRSSSNASDWSQQAKLTAGDGTDVQSYAFFGSSVSISSDGTVALVGASTKDEDGKRDGGAVYVFSRSSTSASDWSQLGKLTAGNGTDVEAGAYFGYSVSISSDGTVALVGAHRKDEDGNQSGAAYAMCSFDPNCLSGTRVGTVCQSGPSLAPTPSFSVTTENSSLTLSTAGVDRHGTSITNSKEPFQDYSGGPDITVILVAIFAVLLLLVVSLACIFKLRRRRRSKLLLTTTGALSANSVLPQPNRSRATSSSSVHRRAASQNKIRHTDVAALSSRSRSSSNSSRRQSRLVPGTAGNRERSGSAHRRSQSVGQHARSETELQVAPLPPRSPIYSSSPHYSPGPTSTYTPAPARSNESERVDTSAYGRSPGLAGVYDNADPKKLSGYGRSPSGAGVYDKADPKNLSGYGRSPGGAGVYQQAPPATKGAPGGYFQLAINWECASCKNVNMPHMAECVSCRRPH